MEPLGNPRGGRRPPETGVPDRGFLERFPPPGRAETIGLSAVTDNRNTVASVLVRDESGGPRLPRDSQPEPLAHHVLPAEAEFYQSYPWTLNAYPTMAEVVEHLRDEISRMDSLPPGWQLAEVMTNVFLLACALSNAIDDHLMGQGYDFSKLRAIRVAGPAVSAADYALRMWRRLRESRLRRLLTWRDSWEAGVNEYVEGFVLRERAGRRGLSRCGGRLRAMLTVGLAA